MGLYLCFFVCQEGWNALLFAIRGGHTEIVGMLVKAGVNVNDVHNVCLNEVFFVLKSVFFVIFFVLICQWRGSALMFAAENGCAEVIPVLLKAGAKVNDTNIVKNK